MQVTEKVSERKASKDVLLLELKVERWEVMNVAVSEYSVSKKKKKKETRVWLQISEEKK